jgi:hypothetical protein
LDEAENFNHHIFTKNELSAAGPITHNSGEVAHLQCMTFNVDSSSYDALQFGFRTSPSGEAHK